MVIDRVEVVDATVGDAGMRGTHLEGEHARCSEGRQSGSRNSLQ